ncbi:hypothetical protein GCM10023084_40520 [Streptomyces lacrimifluminis]|uniref:Uncharacterized protein n=1 Tax=Streptomyces lacrimifluminis TaxID=1500077 RepID=A0A917L3Z1_9ACTN|nr:hypothetical protein GCM10012282_42140 [Streptomyces lacrimifluminis]
MLGAGGVVPQHVGRRRQEGQRRVLAHDVVGVEGEEIVGLATGALDVAGPVVPEVDPRFLVEFTRDAVERCADQVLCAVRGAGVTDDPVVDEVPYGAQAPFDHLRFVLDDHAEAESLLFHGANVTCAGYIPIRARGTRRTGNPSERTD